MARVCENEYGAEFKEKPEDVLREADFVSVHVPLLDSTRHLINAERLAVMKKTAFFVNTSRGPVVDEKALVSALQRKHIAGAALDVYEHEPKLAPGLAKLDNILLTPHTASSTIEARAEMTMLAVRNILAALAGKKVEHVVNKGVYGER